MHFICKFNDVKDGDAREFVLQDCAPHTLIVLKLAGEFHVYRNSCPHTGVNLNWMPHQFFDTEHRYLQCAMHGALFRPQDGYCVQGPCAGQSLYQYACKVVDDSVYLQDTSHNQKEPL